MGFVDCWVKGLWLMGNLLVADGLSDVGIERWFSDVGLVEMS